MQQDCREMPLRIRRHELQLRLAANLNMDDSILPGLDLLLKGFDEQRPLHRDRLDDLVVQDGLDVVDGGEDRHPRVSVHDRTKDDVLPFTLHLQQVLLKDVFLQPESARFKWCQLIY